MDRKWAESLAWSKVRPLTDGGGGCAADVAQGPRLHASRAAEFAHGGGQSRLNVEVGTHVLGLLLAPHHLRVPVLRYHLHAPTTALIMTFNWCRILLYCLLLVGLLHQCQGHAKEEHY